MTMFQNLRRSLPPHRSLAIACERCGREVRWSQGEAVGRLGADASPPEIRRRLVCGGCGAREAIRLWIV